MTHDELTRAYYIEHTIDRSTFLTLHSQLPQSIAKPTTKTDIEVRLEKLEADVALLKTK